MNSYEKQHILPWGTRFIKDILKFWVGCHALLQGIFLTQRSNPCLLHLLHWQTGSLPLAPPWEWKLLSCVWLWDPMDCWLPGSSVHGILLARILEWIAVPFSRGSSQDWTQVSHTAGIFVTIWATREAQEYWNGESIPSPGNLPNPSIELGSPALQRDSLPVKLPKENLFVSENYFDVNWKETDKMFCYFLLLWVRHKELRLFQMTFLGFLWSQLRASFYACEFPYLRENHEI